MNKVLKRYKFIMVILFLFVGILLVLNICMKIETDKITVLNIQNINQEDEFKQAKENRFISFKNELLNQDIVLDNIIIEDDDVVKFTITKNMYLDEINNFIQFLNNISYLRINNMNIIKNNFDYNVNISAEI